MIAPSVVGISSPVAVFATEPTKIPPLSHSITVCPVDPKAGILRLGAAPVSAAAMWLRFSFACAKRVPSAFWRELSAEGREALPRKRWLARATARMASDRDASLIRRRRFW